MIFNNGNGWYFINKKGKQIRLEDQRNYLNFDVKELDKKELNEVENE